MTRPSRLILGTRGSALALWQSNWVAARLRERFPGLTVTLEVIKTSGDRFQEQALTVIGGKGAFTKEIQDALLGGAIDLAVHSLKDLPTDPVPGLRVWAHPARFDPRDAWIGRDGLRYADLPARAQVATGALRRAAQLRHRFPSVEVVPIRGNVDTRLRKFRDGAMHGMFLAAAGLDRLGLAEVITERLAPDDVLPAPGQGALAVEGRADGGAGELLAALDDPPTRARVTAERAFLAALEGGCQLPVAAHATLDGDTLHLDALVADLDGRELVRDARSGPAADAAHLGEALARALLDRGGAGMLARARRDV